MKKLLLSIGVILAIIFSLADFTPFVSATLFIPAQLQPFILAGSGVSAGATSITLTSLKDIDGNALTMSNFGYKGYVTIEPGKSGREEQASFTGITGNTLTGVSHVAFTSTSTSFTETSGLTKSHPGGATVVVSNTSGFYSQYAAKVNDEAITGSWTFPVPTSYYNPAIKGYVDSGFISNSTTTAQSIASNLTASGTLNVVGQATFTLAPRTSAAPSNVADLTNKAYVDAQIIAGGVPAGTSTRGTAYLSTAPASSTAPIVVGDNDTRLPTQDENNALVGVTTSTPPSASNPFADKAYVDLKASQGIGGTGADGALIATSTTVSIDLASSSVVTKNYTSVSITGTGSINFINPAASGTAVIFLVQGDFIATSSTSTAIDLRNLGAPGGIGGTHNTTSTATAGSKWQMTNLILGGTAGGGAITTTPGTLAATSSPFYNAYSLFRAVPGNGGGGGGGSGDGGTVSGGNGGAGGRGAGALYIQVGGNFNASANVNMSGTNGTVGGDSGSWGGCAQGPSPGAGGGGGAGGSFVADVAGTITNTMVFTLSGGTGGGSGNVIGSGVTGCGTNSAYGSGGGGSPSIWGTGNGAAGGTGGTGASGYWVINKRPILIF